jgi:hypothetical protein
MTGRNAWSPDQGISASIFVQGNDFLPILGTNKIFIFLQLYDVVNFVLLACSQKRYKGASSNFGICDTTRKDEKLIISLYTITNRSL